MERIRISTRFRLLLCLGFTLCAALGSMAVASTASAVSFTPAGNYGVGANPYSVISGDFDGDGYLDLATADLGAGTVTVLSGNGHGGFAPGVSYAAGAGATSIVSADFDHDGWPDLATADNAAGTVSVLLGNGGGFEPPHHFAVGTGPTQVITGDFNSDGYPDLASANVNSNDFSVLAGDGHGGFFPAGTYPTLPTTFSIASADLDGDGRLDMAAVSYATDKIEVRPGDGMGGFGPGSQFMAGPQPRSVIAADVTADGLPELIVTNMGSNTVSVLVNLGAGTFAPQVQFPVGTSPISMVVADFDGDGHADIATANLNSNDLSVLLGDGTGHFEPPQNFPVEYPTAVTSGDFDGDGQPDLASSEYDRSEVAVLLNHADSPQADVSITKTAAPSDPHPGDEVTYYLKAKNNGSAVADNVIVSDPLPAGVTFVSADSPCVNSGGTVTCDLGSLDPGAETVLEVKVKVDPWGTPDTAYEHLIDVQRVEAQIDLNAGEQRTVPVSCPSGFFVTDGSVRIDHVDQGSGDWTAPQVLESYASAPDTWQGTVRNTAAGRAQAKIFAVCMRKTTSPNGHSHNLIVSGGNSVTHVAGAPGPDQAELSCGPGQIAIQPGFVSSVPADLTYSEPEGNGWKFVLDMKASGTVTYGIQCLTRQVAATSGHIHDLNFQHIEREFAVDPGNVNEAQLTCADGYKGIVADQDLDQGLASLGNDPRPVTRAFRLYNPTDHTLWARLSLLCIADRTGGEHSPPKVISNTAYISTSSFETDTGNNTSTAVITAEDTGSFTPIPTSTPVKPTPNNPIATTIVGKGVSYLRNAVVVTLRCSGPCRGSARLVTRSPVFVKGQKIKKGALLARGVYRLRGAGERKLRLKVNRRGRKALKQVRHALLKLSSGSSWTVNIR